VRGGLDLEVAMKISGEIEVAEYQGMSKFEQEFMGRGPKNIRSHRRFDARPIAGRAYRRRAASRQDPPGEKGRDLLKQVRTHLVETARPAMEARIAEITGMKVLSLHHDISTRTGEEIVVFTLAEPPFFRETKKSHGF